MATPIATAASGPWDRLNVPMIAPDAAPDGEATLPALTAACQGFALLALEGLSLGLCVAEIALWSRLPGYAARNEIAEGARTGLLIAMAAGAAAFSAGGALLLRTDPRGAHAVRRLGRRL